MAKECDRTPLNAEDLLKTHAYWRACNYLMLAMIHLQDHLFLREPAEGRAHQRIGFSDTGTRLDGRDNFREEDSDEYKRDRGKQD
jgi:phosphoketolase